MVKCTFGIREWLIFSRKMSNGLFFPVNWERTNLFSLKRDLDVGPFTSFTIAWKRNCYNNNNNFI